ncbi:hypothetical protein [Magnetospirillum sp. XM-1]|uniref:hypothetical protein n=1 Tax=Magnetospirillum sp. XM-1 TaxID=1663591 RepID=UPI0012E335ED|nr:hypothetical protein [Magnetospirillum sp. XM-1]
MELDYRQRVGDRIARHQSQHRAELRRRYVAIGEPTLTQALDVARIKWPSGIETFGEPSFIRRAAQIALSAGICVNNSPMSDDPVLGARLSESERRFAINMVDLTEILPRYGFVSDNDAAPESGVPFSMRTADGSLTTIFVQRNPVGIWHWVQWSFDAPFGLRNASGNASHFLIHFGFAHNLSDAMKQLDEEIMLLQADAIRQSMAMRRDEVRHDHTSARQQWTSADPSWLHGYLKEMGITEATKTWAGDVCRCDDLGYAVFQRRDERGHPTGYERYHHIRQDRLSVGGSQNGIIAMGDTQSPERIVIFDNAVSALQSAQAERLPAATLYVSTGGDGESKALRHMLACHPSALIQVVDSPWLSTRLEDAGHSIERIPDTTTEPHEPGPMAATVEATFAHAMASDEAEITTERIEFIGVLDDALLHPKPNSEDNQINDPCQEAPRPDLNETLLDPEDYPAP